MLSTEKAFLLNLGFEVSQVLDEAQLVSLIDGLDELGIKLTSPFSNETPEMVISCIKSLGMEAADKNMKSGFLDVAVSLGLIGEEATINKDNKLVFEIILALKLLGKKAAENCIFTPFLLVAISQRSCKRSRKEQNGGRSNLKPNFLKRTL